MIDLEKLYDYKDSFGFFANQLTYPELADFPPVFLKESFTSEHPAYCYMEKYYAEIQDLSFDELEELYCETFDFQKNSTLYMTFFKFEDGKERGQMLAKLKTIYEMFGLTLPTTGELPDFLPLMCEFLYVAEWKGDSRARESFQMLIAVLEDGTFHLLESLKEQENPYFHLVKGLRETFKVCILREARGHA